MIMKLKLLSLLALILLFEQNIFSQGNIFLNFDDGTDYPELSIYHDSSISNKNWQIGRVNKTKFKPEQWNINSFCTDTINTLNNGDTFSTIFKIVGKRSKFNTFFLLYFNYKIDGDTNDIGIVEISVDQGKSWVDLIKDAKTYDIRFNQNITPQIKGSKLSWQNFVADLRQWKSDIQKTKYPKALSGVDTILYRFTYIKNSMKDSTNGWMVDDIEFIFEPGIIINLANATSPFNIYPQPSSDIINFSNKKDWTIDGIEIYNSLGQKVLFNYIENITSLNTENLPSGLYSVRIKSNEQWYEQKLVVER